MLKHFLVTGGAGFIGSSFIRYGFQKIAHCEKIVNLDLLTYAANVGNLASIASDPRYVFVQGNICDEALVDKLCTEHAIDAIVHFAAESHVDRSILGPKAFYETNVGGTIALLEVLRRHPHIHFHHISTDEVYGSLGVEGAFHENSPYHPNSPYAASKAASDHFVTAYGHTYDLSTSISHCTNNYGPCQNVEKFIPRMISGCYNKTSLPLYGNGKNIRDWIFVDDHSEAVWRILEHVKKGEVYGIGGGCEWKNQDLIQMIIAAFADVTKEDPKHFFELITYVPDRPGHDFRYAIDCQKIKKDFLWSPKHDFGSGIRQTIAWYLENPKRLCTL